jgi:hypothetical protein
LSYAPCHPEAVVISKRLMFLSCACVATATLWPATAAAQRRAVPRARSAVVISAGFYRPYYYPFYSPFYSPFYGAFYAPFYAGWYGFGAPYAYPYPAYYGVGWPSARLEVKPRNAQVFLDGYFVGVVDKFDGVFQRLDVPPGQHELAVYLPGYRTYRQKTLFRPGEGYHFKAVLEPLGAGAASEAAPQPDPNVPDPYREPYRQPREANRPPQDPDAPYPPEPGRTQPPDRLGERRAPENRRPESREFGTVNIRVQPADAAVTIDGERWDSPEGGSRLILQLSGGPHRVEVRKDGFKPYSSTIQVRPGETQSLNVSLPPGGGD